MNMSVFKILLLLLGSGLDLPTAFCQAWVRLPATYTAMKGDVVVSFDLANSSVANYVVNIEWIETGSKLAELPIPIGLTSGAVIFPCGVVVQGGPHKALLTRDGKVRLTQKQALKIKRP